ncbi:MAG: HAMP domain-containing sensor histidine kinase [bacterium]
MSGFAPIVDAAGKTVAVVGIDIDIARYVNLSQRIFSPPLFALLLVVASILATYIILFFWKRRADALHSLNHQRSRMLLVTFHQLGTPLTLVRWATESLKEIQSQITDSKLMSVFTRDLGILTEAGNRFDGILQVLRKADNVQAGKSEYNAISADLSITIKNCIDKLKFIIDKKQQSVKVNIQNPFLCRFDPDQIEVIITELITNASRYSPAKSVVTINATNTFDNVEISVQDEGPGIDSTEAEHMFEEFSRGKKAIEYHPDGYGLGLYINKGIINNAGGRIWVDSKPGQGATFHFTLPQ